MLTDFSLAKLYYNSGNFKTTFRVTKKRFDTFLDGAGLGWAGLGPKLGLEVKLS